jgi:hypothetical protein
MPIGNSEALSSPSPLDLLLRMLNVGQRTGESPIDAALNAQGSLMGSARALPREAAQNQGPLGATISDLVAALNPINWMGGPAGASAAHVPGTFRNIGLMRTQGTPGMGRGPLNPGEYLAALQKEANYPRFQELVQSLVRRKQGPEFDVFRGAPLTDALMQQPLTHGTLPEATAGSLKPEVARDFAAWMGAANPSTPTQVAKMRVTPEAVVGLLPTRGAKYSSEAEMVIDPRKALDIALQGGVQPRPYTVTPPDKALEELLLDALSRGR